MSVLSRLFRIILTLTLTLSGLGAGIAAMMFLNPNQHYIKELTQKIAVFRARHQHAKATAPSGRPAVQALEQPELQPAAVAPGIEPSMQDALATVAAARAIAATASAAAAGGPAVTEAAKVANPPHSNQQAHPAARPKAIDPRIAAADDLLNADDLGTARTASAPTPDPNRPVSVSLDLSASQPEVEDLDTIPTFVPSQAKPEAQAVQAQANQPAQQRPTPQPTVARPIQPRRSAALSIRRLLQALNDHGGAGNTTR